MAERVIRCELTGEGALRIYDIFAETVFNAGRMFACLLRPAVFEGTCAAGSLSHVEVLPSVRATF